MIGGTRLGEYARTIEVLSRMTGKPLNDVAQILYFLYDSQYDNSDLKKMADLIESK